MANACVVPRGTDNRPPPSTTPEPEAYLFRYVARGEPIYPEAGLQGYLAHKKHPPPWNHHRSLRIGLLWGPTGGVLRMSEVPLYPGRGEPLTTPGGIEGA